MDLIRRGAPTKITTTSMHTTQQPYWEAQHATCCMLHSIYAYIGARSVTVASITRFIKDFEVHNHGVILGLGLADVRSPRYDHVPCMLGWWMLGETVQFRVREAKQMLRGD